MRVRRIRTPAELDDLESTWRELEARNPEGLIFQSFAWNRIWSHLLLEPDRRRKLDVRLLEDSQGRARAILPLFQRPLLGKAARLVELLGHQETYHADVLLADRTDDDLVRHVVSALLEAPGGRDVLLLRHLAAESALAEELRRRGLARPMCTRLAVRAEPHFADQTQRMGRSTRSRLRGSANKLRREFGMAFVVRSGAELGEAFGHLLAMHRERFATSGRSSMLVGRHAEFYQSLVVHPATAPLHEIVELRAGDRTIASALMYRAPGRYFCIHTGFDLDFARFSPARLLLTETLRRGFDELGCRSYELGAGYDRYKLDFAPQIGLNFYCCLGGAGPWARGVAAAFRAAWRYKVVRPGLRWAHGSAPAAEPA